MRRLRADVWRTSPRTHTGWEAEPRLELGLQTLPQQRPGLWKLPAPHSSELGGLSASGWQRCCWTLLSPIPAPPRGGEALGAEPRRLQRALEQLPRGIPTGITGGSCRSSRCHGGDARGACQRQVGGSTEERPEPERVLYHCSLCPLNVTYIFMHCIFPMKLFSTGYTKILF